jgi:hypothetical protein
VKESAKDGTMAEQTGKHPYPPMSGAETERSLMAKERGTECLKAADTPPAKALEKHDVSIGIRRPLSRRAHS